MSSFASCKYYCSRFWMQQGTIHTPVGHILQSHTAHINLVLRFLGEHHEPILRRYQRTKRV